MNMAIRSIKQSDAECVKEMMRVFYASPAVQTNGSEMIFDNDIAACVGDSPFLEGVVFEKENEILGYAMISRSFSTECGKLCIWIEDLYIKEAYRGQGVGSAFFTWLDETYPGEIKKLEVEMENERAVHVYETCGYEALQYYVMRKWM